MLIHFYPMEPDMEPNVIDSNKGKQGDYLLPVSILVAGLMISGSVIYLVGGRDASQAVVGGGEATNKQLAVLNTGGVSQLSDRDVILGDPGAPVTFIEYGDYQCPFCGRFFRQVEVPLREEYIKPGKVRMVFRNFQFLGPESVAAAEAAECAKDQRQFWAYHDALYEVEIQDGRENNGNLNRDLFLKLAGDLGLDTGVFANCVDSGKYSEQISRDRDDAQAAGVNSTPTSLINGREVRGALPYSQIKSIIDGLL